MYYLDLGFTPMKELASHEQLVRLRMGLSKGCTKAEATVKLKSHNIMHRDPK